MQAPAQATHTQGHGSQLWGAHRDHNAGKCGKGGSEVDRGEEERDQGWMEERKRGIGGRWRGGNEGSGGWRRERREASDVRTEGFYQDGGGDVCTTRGKDGSCLDGSGDKVGSEE